MFFKAKLPQTLPQTPTKLSFKSFTNWNQLNVNLKFSPFQGPLPYSQQFQLHLKIGLRTWRFQQDKEIRWPEIFFSRLAAVPNFWFSACKSEQRCIVQFIWRRARCRGFQGVRHGAKDVVPIGCKTEGWKRWDLEGKWPWIATEGTWPGRASLIIKLSKKRNGLHPMTHQWCSKFLTSISGEHVSVVCYRKHSVHMQTTYNCRWSFLSSCSWMQQYIIAGWEHGILSYDHACS